MTRLWKPFILIALIATGAAQAAREANLSSINEVRQTILPNGVKVLTKVNPSSEIVAFRAYLRVGPRFETPAESGLSNLMLRLLQSGTESRSAVEIATAIDSIGAELSTDVNKDYGSLVLKTTRETFPEGLEILFDCLLRPTFPEDRFLNERDTVLKEIRQEKDSLLTEAFRLFQQELYRDHPYGLPALGTEESVEPMECEDVVRFYRERLDPADLVFVAVGNFDPAFLMKRIEEETGGLKVRPAAQPRALDGALMPLPVEPSSYHFERVSEAEWLVMGYLAPPIASKDYAAMKVLDSIMGGSMNSRLFTELRDKKGLAYQVGSMYPSRLGPSIFATYIGASPENHDGVVAGILEEVERIKNEPVPEEELERAKTYIKGTFIMSQESNMGQASLYGTYEMLGVGYPFVDEYPALIGEVTAEKVQQAARAYLNFYTLTTISPKAGALDESAEKTSGQESQD